MGLEFSIQELLQIYGEFSIKVRELETSKIREDITIAKIKRIDKEIQLYLPVVKKIEAAYPRFATMKSFRRPHF